MKKTFIILLGIIFCAISLILIDYLPLDEALRVNLKAEVVGSGLLAFIITSIFFYFQGDDEYNIAKSQSRAFFNDKLLSDLQEAFNRHISPWNLSGMNKFYLDDSRVNYVYDIYQNNFDDINKALVYFPKETLLIELKKIYKKIRQAYVLGEEIEGVIYQLVRAEHHRRGLISANDSSTREYLKCKLFAGLSDEDVIKYLELSSVPERMKEVLLTAEQKNELISLLEQMKALRIELLTDEQALKDLLAITQPLTNLSFFSVSNLYTINKKMKKEVVVPVVVASLVFAGVGFFGGVQFQKSQRVTFGAGGQGNFMMQGNGGQRSGQGGNRMMGQGQGFRPTVGEIISTDDKSITVKMEDGSSKIVLISDTTQINKTDPGTKNDLTVGTKVGVFGVDNNGTVTAQNIQINPEVRGASPSAVEAN